MKTPRLFSSTLLLGLLAFTSCQTQLPVGDNNVQKEVALGYVEAPSTLSPLNYEAKNRQILAHVYEPLVGYDTTFNPKTALAVSWGRLDEKTWDFHLREGVWFHNGTTFEADDVVYSLNLARKDPSSGLISLLSGIESVEKINTNRIQITTAEPDSLLLNRLTNVYIFPDKTTNFNLPIGTGPYRFSEFRGDDLGLEAFGSYWGEQPDFEGVTLKAIADSQDRVKALKSKEIQVLLQVPPQDVESLQANGFTLTTLPSLEVSFLMFNEDGILGDPKLRSLVWLALRDDYAAPLGGTYLKDLDQFAATGIFGRDPDLPVRSQDVEAALAMRADYGDLELTLDVPEGLEALGEELKADLRLVNIGLNVNVLEAESFEDKILTGASDFYFFGWKYDLADVSDFYESVLHSDDERFGAFNGMNYSNPDVDALIEQARASLNTEERADLLSEIARKVLEDQIALPLFEAELIYAFAPEVTWSIRLDGRISASDLRQNVVE